MPNKRICSLLGRLLALLCLFTLSAHAQGAGDFAPSQTASNPLQIRIADGSIGGGVLGTFHLNSTNLLLSASQTNYIFLDLTTTPPALTINTTGFPTTTCYKIATVVTSATQITSLTDSRPSFNSTLGSSSGSTSPSTAYTFSVSGGTITATPNASGLSTFSGTDLRAVWDSLIGAVGSTCGRVFFKNGIYNINSLDQESLSSFTLFYGVGIPGTGSASNQYCKWIIEGESATAFVGESSMPIQTSGVIFNVTSTAVTAAGASTNEIAGIWARPDTNGLGASVFLSNITVRFPTNQRGCIAGKVDLSQALDAEVEDVLSDFNIQYSSLAVPVAGAGCSGGEPSGSFGIVSTNSAKNDNWIKNSHGVGDDASIDIRSEHTLMFHSGGQFCNNAIQIGVNSPNTLFHPSAIQDSGWGECLRGVTLGSKMGSGSSVEMLIDMEDATASSFPSFQPVYHFKETNSGNTGGFLRFTRTLANVGIVGLPAPFDGGGGGAFQTLQLTFDPNLYPLPAFDSFPNASGKVNQTWVDSNTGSGCAWTQSTNLAIAAAGENCQFTRPQTPQDQYSRVTITTLTANCDEVSVRGTSSNNYYAYLICPASRTLRKRVAGTFTTISGPTGTGGSSGDVVELWAVCNNTACSTSSLFAFRNGALDLSGTDSSLTSGMPGGTIGGSGDQIAAWSGGALPLWDQNKTTFGRPHMAAIYFSLSNCTSSGGTCGSASEGAVTIATSATTVTVATTAIGTNSNIQIGEDSTMGTRLGVTCNTTLGRTYAVTTRTPGTSFIITASAAPTTNPACLTYRVTNQ